MLEHWGVMCATLPSSPRPLGSNSDSRANVVNQRRPSQAFAFDEAAVHTFGECG
jgi:hypothetical protein